MSLPLAVGTDGPDAALRAVDFAFGTGQFDAATRSARPQAEEWLHDTGRDATAKYPEAQVRWEVAEGQARKSLRDAARIAEPLVVGAGRRSGAFGLQLGLVNHAMLHYSPCPVAVVPHE
jgi:nucleotide-binding universal stress UspA family protein